MTNNDFTGADLASLGPDFNSDLTPETIALAQSNTNAGLSTQARLDQAHKDAIRNLTNALAARGALSSGEAGFQLGREQQNYTQAGYDARQRLVDLLSGDAGAFAQSERARQAQSQQNIMAALQSLLAMYPNGFGGGGGGGYSQQSTDPVAAAGPAPQTTYSNPGGGTPITGPSIFAFK